MGARGCSAVSVTIPSSADTFESVCSKPRWLHAVTFERRRKRLLERSWTDRDTSVKDILLPRFAVDPDIVDIAAARQ